MSLQKQKNTIKNLEARIGAKLTTPHPGLLRLVEPAALLSCVVIMLFTFQPAKVQAPAQPKDTAHHKTTVHHKAPKKKPVPKPKPAPKPVTTPAPAPAPAPKPAATAGSSKVEPVVKPAPTSKVSGLAPTSPTPAPTPSKTTTPTSTQVTTGYTSLNWSGYMAANAKFTSVSSSWVAPNATGNGSTTTADSTWIGIGGVTSGDLIQTGTQNTISASGQRYTSAFYEMLPDASINITSMTVTAGDSMTASIKETGSSVWAISITDNTTGKSFSKTVSYTSSLSSAEWIEEDPSYSSGSLVLFDNFNEAIFSGAAAIANGTTVNLSTSTAQPIIMVNNSGKYIAVPSTISGGNSFTVTP